MSGNPILPVDSKSRTPLMRQIVDGIRRGIVEGRWRPGEKIPSVRKLASSLRVNPMTVSKAYKALVSEGVVRRVRGSGMYVLRLPGSKSKSHEELLGALVRDIEEVRRQGWTRRETGRLCDDAVRRVYS